MKKNKISDEQEMYDMLSKLSMKELMVKEHELNCEYDALCDFNKTEKRNFDFIEKEKREIRYQINLIVIFKEKCKRDKKVL